MLLKKTSNLNAEKLKAIVLIEAGYNWISKPPVNKCLITQAESLLLLPEKKLAAVWNTKKWKLQSEGAVSNGQFCSTVRKSASFAFFPFAVATRARTFHELSAKLAE